MKVASRPLLPNHPVKLLVETVLQLKTLKGSLILSREWLPRCFLMPKNGEGVQ